MKNLTLTLFNCSAYEDESENTTESECVKGGEEFDCGAYVDESEYTSESECPEGGQELYTVQRQRKIMPSTWEGVKIEKVDRIPKGGIDGLKIYELNTTAPTSNNKQELLKDGRKWKKDSRSFWKGHGDVHYSDCQGSHRCENFYCEYRTEYGVINTTHFEKGKDRRLKCCICETHAHHVPCPARKYVVPKKNSVRVYHFGTHTCAVVPPSERQKEKVERMFRENPDMKPSQVQSTAILHDIRQRKPWEEVKKTAKSFGDKKWISNQKQKIKNETQPYGHNFEAVATYKQYCDKRDPYYIYKMNDKRGNPDRPSFVFKSSKLGAKFALNMTEDEDHILSKEYCCFDGKVNRCKGLVTLTASVYHPILHKQVILASMECESESTETVALFWSLFNEMLSKVTGVQGFIFNPRGWCSDMAGSNLQGIKQVFVEDALQKVKGCEFHFKQCRNRHARTLRSEEARQKFTKLCDALLSTATPPAYYSAKEDLTKFIDEAPQEREHLILWIKWWDDRRTFIFPAFAPWDGASKINQAEVIHASWAHRDRENMTLLDAAECHIRDCVLLETEYEGTKQGNSRPGTGPSLMQRRARVTAIQQRRAARLGEKLLREDISIAEPEPQCLGRKVDPACSHRADKPRKRNTSGTSRFRSVRSAHFLSRLQKAKQDKGSIKLRKVLSQSDVSCRFEVQGSDGQRKYEVEVSAAPSCTCEDYKKFNGKELCKHVIWVYLYILKVDDESPIINQITLSEDSVRQIMTESAPIASSSVDNISPSNDFRSRMERVKSILSKDKRKDQQLMWYLLHKERKPGKIHTARP